jgi:hypothetical protein
MKRILLSVLAVFALVTVNAQDDNGGATSKGSILVEANTGNAMLGTTGIYFTSSDGSYKSKHCKNRK